MTAKQIELKPCPFCGAKAESRTLGEYRYIACSSRRCPVRPQTRLCRSLSTAGKGWNTRKGDK